MQRHYNDYPQKHQGHAYELKSHKNTAALLVSQQGARLREFYLRLAVMRDRASLDKNITPHGLRHSIATHLLQSGMDIEEIARFLGHASLGSTQVYTHILNESPHA